MTYYRSARRKTHGSSTISSESTSCSACSGMLLAKSRARSAGSSSQLALRMRLFADVRSAQIPVCRHGSPLQRDLVHCGDLRQLAGGAARALLGRCSRTYAGRYEDADGDGVAFRQNKRCLPQQKAFRGAARAFYATADAEPSSVDACIHPCTAVCRRAPVAPHRDAFVCRLAGADNTA